MGHFFVAIQPDSSALRIIIMWVQQKIPRRGYRFVETSDKLIFAP